MLRPKFTNAGKALQIKAAVGAADIVFTKMQLGSGELGDTDYRLLSGLISPKATLSLSGIKVEGDYATVKGTFSNAEMAEGFYYRELGLFARDPEHPGNEILYCYCNYIDQGGYIADPGSELIEKVVRIVAVVDDAASVTAVLDDTASGVDHTELTQAIEAHNSDEHAHDNLINFDVVFYVDSSTDEDAELRTGEAAHPFKSLSEARDAIPLSALRVSIIIAQGSASYTGLPSDDRYFEGLKELSIEYAGTLATRPVIAGSIAVKNCDNVTIKNIRFTETLTGETAQGHHLLFEGCGKVWVEKVLGSSLDAESVFISAINSAVTVSSCNAVGAYTAIAALSGAVITVISCVISSGSTGLLCSHGVIIVSSITTNTATIPFLRSDGGIIINSDTAADITTGAVHNHLSNISNPHQVTLTQAQTRGGTIDASHGGTGKTSLAAGALLKGAGTSAVETLLGLGALFASVSGSPQFGTLPISCGGTGRTESGVWKNSDQSGFNDTRGCVKLLDGVMIQWGYIRMSGSSQSVSLHSAFADTKYIIAFNNWTVTLTNLTKNTNSFEVERLSGVDEKDLEWIAIGFAAS